MPSVLVLAALLAAGTNFLPGAAVHPLPAPPTVATDTTADPTRTPAPCSLLPTACPFGLALDRQQFPAESPTAPFLRISHPTCGVPPCRRSRTSWASPALPQTASTTPSWIAADRQQSRPARPQLSARSRSLTADLLLPATLGTFPATRIHLSSCRAARYTHQSVSPFAVRIAAARQLHPLSTGVRSCKFELRLLGDSE